MRRLVILALLFGGMQLILPLGSRGQGSWPLLAFGFLILAAYSVGELATSFHLPKIVGYLSAGVIFGPHLLGAVDKVGTALLSPVSDLAVALIAFLAGAELRWDEVKERGVLLLKITVVELAIGFVALFALLYGFRSFIPFLADSPGSEALAFALLFAATAVVHSPAVTMALLSETGAHGPVARTTLGVVLITDIVVVLFFSGALAVARAIAPPTGAVGLTFGAVVWEIGGAILIGAVLGWCIALYLRYVGKDLPFFAILVAFFGLTIAHLAHTELLLTMLLAGFMMENRSPRGQGTELLHAMERSAAPVFVVFFALSGAKIELSVVWALLFLVGPIALVRAGAIWAGTRIGGRWAGASEIERKYIWMGLISQAGVAIGLAAIVAQAYPVRGAQLSSLLLALIAVNESIGPVLFRRALGAAGEVGDDAGSVK
jgi:Kef-type K+ transport system membrane component KefB